MVLQKEQNFECHLNRLVIFSIFQYEENEKIQGINAQHVF